MWQGMVRGQGDRMHGFGLSAQAGLTACATVSDRFRPPDSAGLHVAHHFRSRACHTCVWPTRLDSDTLPQYTTSHTPRRPARLLVLLHTPTNPAHLRRVP